MAGLVSKVMDIAGAVRRFDAWFNETTGLGLPSFDKSKGTSFLGVAHLSDPEIDDLYHGYSVARKVCEYLPNNALRRGACYKGTASAVCALERRVDTLNLLPQVQEAAIWGRTYGRSCLAIHSDGANDEPLKWIRGMPVYGVRVFDGSQIEPLPNHDPQRVTTRTNAMWFRITPPSESPFIIHRSRALWFGGIRTTAKRREFTLNGRDDSCLQPVIEELRSFAAANLALDHMLSDASQAVFKMHGLLALLAGDSDAVAKRASVMDVTRSHTRAVYLDAGSNEEFSKVPTEFSGVADVWDRFAQRVAGAADMTVTELFGISPAGLNATGENDRKKAEDTILAYRRVEIIPKLNALAWVLSPDGARIELPPLTEPTEKEHAERDKIRSDIRTQRITSFVAMVQSEIMMPEQAAKQLSDEGEIEIDLSLFQVPSIDPTIAPAGLLPPSGDGEGPKLVLTPSDAAAIVTVNEARASLGFPPAVDPADGLLTLAAYKAKNAATIAKGEAASQGEAPAAPGVSALPVPPAAP